MKKNTNTRHEPEAVISVKIPRDIKERLQQRAAAEYRTVSDQLRKIIVESLEGGAL